MKIRVESQSEKFKVNESKSHREEGNEIRREERVELWLCLHLTHQFALRKIN
jgi:hypothetical protein